MVLVWQITNGLANSLNVSTTTTTRVLTIRYTENAGVVASTSQLLATLQSIPEAILQSVL